MTDVRRKLAREILDHFPDPTPVLSLYCDTDRSRRAPREIALSLKNLFRDSQEMISGWDGDSRKTAKEELDAFLLRMESMVQPVPPGWAIFLFPGGEPLIYPLPMPVGDSCAVDLRPRIFPLVQAVGPFRATLVVVFEGQEVRFFRRLGNRLDLLEKVPEDIPSRIKAGGRYGMDERRIERHAREEMDRILSSLSIRAREIFEAETFDRLLVAGSRELEPRLLEHLRTDLAGVSCERVPEYSGSDSSLKVRLDRWATAHFWEEGERLVEKIQKESGGQGLASSGWRAVLAASNRGAVHCAVAEEYEPVEGVRCVSCGALGLDEESCPVCGAVMKPEGDMMEALFQRTLRQDGDVMVLGRPSPLRDSDGVGVLLRFAI